jgi:hypothetical protein
MPEGTKTTFLSNQDPLRAVPAEGLALIEPHMHLKRFSAGEHLIRQGEAATSIMIIREGIAEVYTESGGSRQHINKISQGEVLGEMALLSGEARSASVLALSDVEVRVLPAERFHQLAREHPAISLVLTQLVADRLGGSGPDVLQGKTFHGHRIVRRLGRGGMSVVYEGVDEETGRLVALKMMSHSLVYDELACDQFEREARVIESLRHENIVGVYDRFAAFHSYFLVMEHCSGANLAEVLRHVGAIPADTCRKILGQLARALHTAHAAGLVHRDVKPANVMLTVEGTIKLMDFGLATPVLDEALKSSDSPVVGTPRYMAPEQLAGEPVGQAVDFFALGCVVYELLTGQPLFPETKLPELLLRRAAWRLPDFASDRPDLPEWALPLLNHCLQKRPEQRRPDLKSLASHAAPVPTELLPSNDARPQQGNWEDDTVVES